MCDVESSDIRGGTRKGYYCEADNLSNIYGMYLGLGGAYVHKLVNISLDGLVWWYWVGGTS